MLTLKTLAAALALVGAAGAFAQAAPASSMPRVDQRQANQERRIDQGVTSGALTKRETARLEKEQAHVEKAETRAQSDGTVTKKERRHLHRMQDRASADIYHQKHDRQRAASAPGK
ncbi:MAG TPA: hypothetical protein VGQ23_17240 [Burkholderiaceae bacterium]|jgi:hypothetical protein|nr:hypothetical protein [Burkholderiaceae bacterium]